MLKLCGRCRQEKHLLCFNKDKNREDGLYPTCRDCRKELQKQYRQTPGFKEKQLAFQKISKRKKPNHYREWGKWFDKKRKYGITKEQFFALSKAQNDSCAICKRQPKLATNGKKKELAIDHDHKTGKIRGLLCINCNTSIGKMQDSPELLRKAAEYLELSL